MHQLLAHKSRKTFTIVAQTFCGLLLTWSCWMLGKIVFSYIPFSDSAGFLVVKRSWLEYDWWRFSFKVHVYSSGIAMLAGFTQFWNKFKHPVYKKLHRRLGYVYVITILGFSLPSGLVLALTALGGLIVKMSFTVLCILWGITTVAGVKFALNRQLYLHKVCMTYSYALTLSAVTLRSFKLLLYQLAPFIDWLTPMHIYQVQSVSSWVVNLLIAWAYLRWQRKNRLPENRALS